VRPAAAPDLREIARGYEARGLPPGLAVAVAKGSMTLQEATDRLAREAEVEQLMRKHGLSRAIAVQVQLGHASLTQYLDKVALQRHLDAHRLRSCLEEAAQSGAPLVVGVHGQRRFEAKVVEVEAYHVTLAPTDGSAPERVHKLQLKYACPVSEIKRVRNGFDKDKSLAAAPLDPISRPQDRYGIPDKKLFTLMSSKRAVEIVLLEGERMRGTIQWFGRYELGFSLQRGGSLTVFRHAIHAVKEG
jgi:sRNA-binding regulator protein Hfq